MHIITGILIASLLGKKKQKPLMPLIRTGPVQTAHFVPGRIRFRVPSLGARGAAAALLEEKLPNLQGVQSIKLNRLTGSVLIHYRAGQLRPELLFAVTVRLLGLEGELEKMPRPVVVKELQTMFDSLNRAVYDRTGGLLDFSSALLIVLAAVGIGKLTREGMAAFPAGLTLTWWGFTRLLGKMED